MLNRLDRDPLIRQAGKLYRRLWHLHYREQPNGNPVRAARLRQATLHACRRYGRRAGTSPRAL